MSDIFLIRWPFIPVHESFPSFTPHISLPGSFNWNVIFNLSVIKQNSRHSSPSVHLSSELVSLSMNTNGSIHNLDALISSNRTESLEETETNQIRNDHDFQRPMNLLWLPLPGCKGQVIGTDTRYIEPVLVWGQVLQPLRSRPWNSTTVPTLVTPALCLRCAALQSELETVPSGSTMFGLSEHEAVALTSELFVQMWPDNLWLLRDSDLCTMKYCFLCVQASRWLLAIVSEDAGILPLGRDSHSFLVCGRCQKDVSLPECDCLVQISLEFRQERSAFC